MKNYRILIWVVLLFSIATSYAEPLFRIEKVSQRVLLLIEQSPMENIIAAIAGSRGILVIDTGPSIQTARQARELIAKTFQRNDFVWVIHTHPHWDHVFGSQAFAGAWFAAQERTALDIQGSSRTLVQLAASFEKNGALIRSKLDGMTASNPERADLVRQQEFLARNLEGMRSPGFKLITPEIAFRDRMSINLGDLNVKLIHFGRAHSAGDILIHVPEEGVLFTGDLFLDRTWLPLFAGLRTLDIPRWIEVLNELLEPGSAVRTVVLGHHGTWTREKLTLWRDYIVHLWQAVQTAVKEGKTVDDFVAKYPLAAPYMYLKELGHTEERLRRFHEGNIRAFWRQVVPSPLQEIENALQRGGITTAEAKFTELRAAAVSFQEREMNMFGYELLNNGNAAAAVAVFRMNVTLFSKSANAYDSLGEALAAAGNTAEAIHNYRQVLVLDPENQNAKQKLKELQDTKPPSP